MVDIPENIKVLADVLKDVENLGALTEKNFEAQEKEFKELRDSLGEKDSNDIVTQEKITNLATAVSARQEEVDKAKQATDELQKRIDAIEVASQRTGGFLTADDAKDAKEAKDFHISCLLNTGSNAAISYKTLQNLKVNVDEYRSYRDVFEKYIRSTPMALRMFNPEEAKTLTVGAQQEGGYFVLPALSSEVTKQVREIDPIRQLASVVNISTDAIEFSTDLDEIGSGWEAETVQSAESSTPKPGTRRIPVHKLVSRPRASTQMIEDSIINVQSWLAEHAAKKFARDQGAAFVTGNGVDKPRGFTTYTSGTDVRNTIEQVAMGSDTALTADGFIDVMYSLVEPFLYKGTWLMNRSTVAAAMKLKDGEGNYLWRPGMQAGQPSSILNSPVRMSTTMAAIAQNALAVAYADWKDAYMIVDRLGMTIMVDPYTAEPFIKYIMRTRVGGDVKNFQAIKLGKISAS